MDQILQQLKKAVTILYEADFTLHHIPFLKLIASLSKQTQYKVPVAVIYSLYMIIIKFNPQQALKYIQQAFQTGPQSFLSVATLYLMKSVIYSHLDEHKQSLSYLKQAYKLVKTRQNKKHLMKSFYVSIIPKILQLYLIAAYRQEFLAIFEQAYKSSKRKPICSEISQVLEKKIMQLNKKAMPLSPHKIAKCRSQQGLSHRKYVTISQKEINQQINYLKLKYSSSKNGFKQLKNNQEYQKITGDNQCEIF